MMGVFEGMAGVLSDVLGAPVRYLPATGRPRDIQSIFREEPVTVTGDDGRDVLIVAPSWRVSRDLVAELARGDLVQPGNGRTYKVVNHMPTGSPACDGLLLCELEATGP
ncbi:hypothetical protein ERN12_05955 [Rhodobacteraceae bacterium]|nr:hypothetical protein ERN12_05955 [Paracoccaceae bacterium]